MNIVTEYIHPDEGCHGLFEGPVLLPQPDGSTQWRWVQRVFVVRGDTIAKHETDYGPALNFETVQPIFIPGFGDDRVGDILELAEKNRNDFYWNNRREEMLAGSTLIKDHLAMVEQKLLHKSNRSHLGPLVNAQRNDFSRQYIERKVKDGANGTKQRSR